MRCARILPLLLVCTLGAHAAWAQSAPKGSVTGQIFCADTHTPCRFASVTVQLAPPRNAKGEVSGTKAEAAGDTPPAFSSTTDLDGNFQIPNVTPGDYYLLGRLAGYLAPYDLAASICKQEPASCQQLTDAALPRITVNAGAATTASVTLSRGASIGGTVEYDDGGTAINLSIHLYRRDTKGQWKPYMDTANDSPLATLFAPTTNDRGKFYEPGLPPGTYTVEVSLPQVLGIPLHIFGTPALKTLMVRGDALKVFYGNKYRLSEAVPIELRDGEERPDIDIVIATTGLHAIHGFVTAKTDGTAISAGSVQLLDPDDQSVLREADIHEDGTFDFHFIAAGTYNVHVNPQGQESEGKRPVAYEPMTTQLLVENDIPALNYSVSYKKH